MSNSMKPTRAGRRISQSLCIVLTLLTCVVLAAQNQAYKSPRLCTSGVQRN
jgi:hypothetical protein